MTSLAPEQERALRLFLREFAGYSDEKLIPTSELNLEHVTITDTNIFVEGRVNRKTLPHGDYWLWNQSKSKVQKPLEDGGFVKFAKLNPRRVKTHPPNFVLPSYKLWVYEIESLKYMNTVQPLFFLWCEKGKSGPDAQPPCVQSPSKISRASNTNITEKEEEISIEQYAFLRDFIEPHIASQLGWIPSPPSLPQISYVGTRDQPIDQSTLHHPDIPKNSNPHTQPPP